MSVTRREFLILLSTLGLTARNAWAKSDELVVVVHPDAPVRRLNDVELESIFLTDRRFWSGTKPVIAFNLAPHSEARVLFDLAVLRMDPDEVARFWRDRRVRGGSPPPRQAPDPATLLRLVARLDGAIGYAPTELPTGGLRVVARIHHGKVLAP